VGSRWSGAYIYSYGIGDTEMSGYEEEQGPIQAVSVAAELASSPDITATGKVDDVKLTYLVSSDMLPDQLKPMLYSLTYEDVVINRKRFRSAINSNMLRLLDAIKGRGQNNLIRVEQALKGVPTQPEGPAPEKPSMMDRIIDRDKVREYEAWKDRKELGLE